MEMELNIQKGTALKIVLCNNLYANHVCALLLLSTYSDSWLSLSGFFTDWHKVLCGGFPPSKIPHTFQKRRCWHTFIAKNIIYIILLQI